MDRKKSFNLWGVGGGEFLFDEGGDATLNGNGVERVISGVDGGIEYLSVNLNKKTK